VDPHKSIERVSEFFTDKDGEIIFVTEFSPEERDNLIKMYSDFSPDKRCCGLPPVNRSMIEKWIDELSSKGYVFIAKHGEKIIGHIAVVPLNSHAEFVIFVHQDYEGKRIGRELIRFAERVVKKRGVKILEAVTERTNKVAMNLYTELGFEIVDVDPITVKMEKKV
jgi:GNAT superfamily N-acetyltransferase